MAAPKGKLWVQAQLGLPPLLLLTMALAGGSGTAAAEAFDSVLGDTASCHRACQLTYPLHTYPKVGRGPLDPGLPSSLTAHLSASHSSVSSGTLVGDPRSSSSPDPLGVDAVFLPGPACTPIQQ